MIHAEEGQVIVASSGINADLDEDECFGFRTNTRHLQKDIHYKK
jgi:hypothetical protein